MLFTVRYQKGDKVKNTPARTANMLSGTAMLVGAMAFGAACHYSYRELVVTAYAASEIEACSDLPCDAEDPDDCGGPPNNCVCNEPTGICVDPGELLKNQ
jgi:hypothetical protein